MPLHILKWPCPQAQELFCTIFNTFVVCRKRDSLRGATEKYVRSNEVLSFASLDDAQIESLFPTATALLHRKQETQELFCSTIFRLLPRVTRFV